MTHSNETQELNKAMAALDTMATIWAAQFDIRQAVAAMMKLPDGENRLIAFIKHAHAEGLYAGRTSHTEDSAAAPLSQDSAEQVECWSANNEEFCAGSLGDFLESNDELVAGEAVYVADAVTPDPASYINVDDILEQMGERASDECGEWADDYPDVTAEARQTLTELLEHWARTHCKPSFWRVKNVREYVLTPGDLEPS